METRARLKKKNDPHFNSTKSTQPRDTSFFRHPARLILLSFGAVILIGTLLLWLPQATVSGSISIVDALFTATSATCVTGLTVLDTGRSFTTFGQVVILMLIQAGGLGIMTFSTFFVYLIAGRLGLTEREILQGTLSEHSISDFTKLLKLVFVVTVTIESTGWAILTLRFMQEFPPSRAIYLGLFHAISAFCNAGFSLFSNSLENYKDDNTINSVLCGLIILGGLGFVVIFDLYKNRGKTGRRYFKKLSFHTRLVLVMTTLLIVGGATIFFGLEFDNSLRPLSLKGKVLASIFQSVTARTAGFNTLDIKILSNSALFFIITLMFIGASPGSCGGGIKTTTLAVIIASVSSRFRMKRDVNISYRRIPEKIISKAISVIFFSSIIVGLFTMLILITELPEISHSESRGLFLEYMFEVVSSFGTVGLSIGVTTKLSILGKTIITTLMLIGRLGPLTIALAVRGKESTSKFKYVQENVLVG